MQIISNRRILAAVISVSLAVAAGCSSDPTSHGTSGTNDPVVPALYNGNAPHVVRAAYHGAGSSGGQGGQEQCGPTVDQRVTQTLTEMAKKLTGAQSLVFSAVSSTQDVSSTLQKLTFDTTVKGVIKRPNLAYVEKTGAENVTMWFNGAELIVLDRTANTYIRVAVKGDIDALLAKLDELDIEAPFGGLLGSDLETKFSQYVYQGDYYAPTQIGDAQVHHLAMRQENVDWQVWVDMQSWLPKKAVITSKMLAGAPEHQLLIQDLKIDAVVDTTQFKAQLPAGAKEVPVNPQ